MVDDSDTAPRRPAADDGTLTNADPLRPEDRVGPEATGGSFTVGQVLASRYRVERFVARGGMGEVYQVFDQELGESVALKTILPASAGDQAALDRFRREIQLARKVSHPNVCRIFDLGRHVAPDGSGVVFLTMELLQGSSLRNRLLEGPMGPDEALGVVEQMAAGLAAAHRRGIVHRDLKPSNIFLVPDGDGTRVVIADFGLARSQLPDAAGHTVTITGEVLGTPAYMSPEQIEGRPATTASDIYTLGLIMYEMLTGVRAFEGDSAFQVALSKLQEAPTSPSKRRPGVPPRWDRTILRCLEKAPEDRFSEVAEIPAVLAGTRALPRRRWRRIAANRWLRAAAATGLVAIALAGAFAIGGWRPWGGGSGLPGDRAIRRSVAVLGFENVTGDPDAAWISTGLAEMLTTELSAGGAVRAVPGESVSQARAELGLGQVTTLGSDTANRLSEMLTTDLLVLGSYALSQDGEEVTIRLDSRVQDVARDEIIVLPPVTGPRNDLVAVVRRAAAEIRGRLGLDVVAESVTSEAFPSDPEAARLYAEGVARLRSFDPAGARDLLQRAARSEPESPLIWVELSNAWTELGDGIQAHAAAERAMELADGLDRELGLRTEGQYQLLAGRHDEAVDTFRSLWLVYPDNLEYGLLLARSQVEANRPPASLATVAELRALPAPLSADPRIDLAEASAAGAMGDAERQAEAAQRVVVASQTLGSSQLEAEGRVALGSALRALGQLDRAVEELEAARALTASAGNRPGEAKAIYALAVAHAARGDVEQALRTSEQCLQTARAVEARQVEADALNLLGTIRLQQGDLVAAESTFAEALGLQRDLGSESGAADTLNNLALVQMWSGNFVSAVDSFSQARAQYAELGKPQMEAAVVMNLARIDAARGDLDRARSRFEEAAGLFRAQELNQGLAEALFGLGEVLLTQGDLQAARARHEEAMSLRDRSGLPSAVESRFALAGVTLAEAAVGRRSYGEAVEELTAAVEQLAVSGRPALEADAVNYLVEAELGAGRLEAAEGHMERLDELAPAANSVTLMVGRMNRARLAAMEGRLDAAEKDLAAVIEEARNQSSLGVELEARLVMAEILARAGRADEARQWLEEVRREAVARGWMLVADKARVIADGIDGP